MNKPEQPERLPVTVILPYGSLHGELLDERHGCPMATEDGGGVQHVRITLRIRTQRGEMDVIDRVMGRDA